MLSYFFQSDQFESQKRRYVNGAKVRRIAGEKLAKIASPFRQLKSSVRSFECLDLFAALEAELEAELEERRLQYLHYRGELRTRLGGWGC